MTETGGFLWGPYESDWADADRAADRLAVNRWRLLLERRVSLTWACVRRQWACPTGRHRFTFPSSWELVSTRNTSRPLLLRRCVDCDRVATHDGHTLTLQDPKVVR